MRNTVAINLRRLAIETALPVASPVTMLVTVDEICSSYGREVTPVSYDIHPQEGSGQEGKTAVSIYL